MKIVITDYHAKYYAFELTRQYAADGVDRLSQSLFDATVDLNPHQINAALFALHNPLNKGVILADEVGLRQNSCHSKSSNRNWNVLAINSAKNFLIARMKLMNTGKP